MVPPKKLGRVTLSQLFVTPFFLFIRHYLDLMFAQGLAVVIANNGLVT